MEKSLELDPGTTLITSTPNQYMGITIDFLGVFLQQFRLSSRYFLRELMLNLVQFFGFVNQQQLFASTSTKVGLWTP